MSERIRGITEREGGGEGERGRKRRSRSERQSSQQTSGERDEQGPRGSKLLVLNGEGPRRQ